MDHDIMIMIDAIAVLDFVSGCFVGALVTFLAIRLFASGAVR